VLGRLSPVCRLVDAPGQLECRWADGVLALLKGDRARLDRVTAPLVSDSTAIASYLGRSLRALWSARR